MSTRGRWLILLALLAGLFLGNIASQNPTSPPPVQAFGSGGPPPPDPPGPVPETDGSDGICVSVVARGGYVYRLSAGGFLHRSAPGSDQIVSSYTGKKPDGSPVLQFVGPLAEVKSLEGVTGMEMAVGSADEFVALTRCTACDRLYAMARDGRLYDTGIDVP